MDEISSKSIQDICKSIVSLEVSAESLCSHFLDKIDDNSQGAITFSLRDSALSRARHIDEVISSGKPVGGLAGIPVAIKDNVNTVPAICAAGLPQLTDFRPNQDALIVSKIKQADAVIIGMTATDSGAFGVTTPNVINPIFPERVVGGSSGGSGAAVAARFCKFAIGTDTGGSIRIPSACCGVSGFKPTYQKDNLEGILPLAISYDHVGPIAATATDLLYVMKTLFSNRNCGRVLANLKTVRIGIPESFFSDASREVQEMMDEFRIFAESLQLQVQTVEIPSPEQMLPNHLVLSLTEAALYHSENFPEKIKDYPAVARDSITLAESYSSCDYLRAKQANLKAVREIHRIFDSVDFLVLPTLPVLIPKRSDNYVMLRNEKFSLLEALIRYTAPFNQAGIPVVAIPWHFKKNKIFGSIQLTGPTDSDFRLLEFAQMLENQMIDYYKSVS